MVILGAGFSTGKIVGMLYECDWCRVTKEVKLADDILFQPNGIVRRDFKSGDHMPEGWGDINRGWYHARLCDRCIKHNTRKQALQDTYEDQNEK